MDATNTNPENAHAKEPEPFGRRTFLKGASIVGGSLMTAGLITTPQIAVAREVSGKAAATSAASPRRAGSAELTRKEEEVLRLIKEDEVASVLQDFVRIPTAMANEQAGAEYFARRLREWGMDDVMIQGVEGHPGRSNLIARLPGKTPKGPTLMTTSHLDSIMVEDTADQDDWFADPFAGVIRDGRVYGLGASDNKSGCVAKIMAAKAIREAEVELPGDLLTVLVADEEGYMLGIKEFIKAGLHKEVSGAYGEGVGTANYQAETRPGRTMATITFYGSAFHAGTAKDRPGVVNAIHKAGKFISVIADAWPDHPADPYYGRPFYQVSMVQGGWAGTTQTSQKPAFCRLFFDARLVPDQNPDDVWKDVQRILDRLARDDKEFKYTIGEIDRRPGYRLDPEWPVVKAAASAYEGLAGKPAIFGNVKRDTFSIGTTDTHYLAKLGIPCANIISPANSDAQGHRANEYISTKSLVEGTRATALTIMRYWDFVNG